MRQSGPKQTKLDRKNQSERNGPKWNKMDGKNRMERSGLKWTFQNRPKGPLSTELA